MKAITIQADQISVSVLPLGARIVSVQFTGKELALKYSDTADYLKDTCYLGASIGPIANRIADASLRVGQRAFKLPSNDGKHCLHSGGVGFDKKMWSLKSKQTNAVSFSLVYDLAELGLQGQLEVTASYRVNQNCLYVDYIVQSDTDTYVNTTNHVYLNLAGDAKDFADHTFKLYGEYFLQGGEDNIPTGAVSEFKAPLAYSLANTDTFDGAVDHHFHVKNNDSELAIMAQVESGLSGIGLKILSNSPGYQFYTGRFLGAPFGPSAGFCVETQYAPDAINQAKFYSPLLAAGVPRTQHTAFEFSARENLE